MRVHVVLPGALRVVAADALGGVPWVAHDDPVAAAEAAVSDSEAVALLGPVRSAEVAEAAEVTAPAGLALLAPVATWAGVTRDDEPGCDDAPPSRGTVLRGVARDTVVAERLAGWARANDLRARVIAGEHDYGRQLDAQLRLTGLPRADDSADVVVLCGLAGQPEVRRAAAIGLPVIAFDGVQGDQHLPRDLRLAVPYPPGGEAGPVRRAAELLAGCAAAGDRRSVLGALRAAGPFDAHGDPVAPPVALWRGDALDAELSG